MTKLNEQMKQMKQADAVTVMEVYDTTMKIKRRGALMNKKELQARMASYKMEVKDLQEKLGFETNKLKDLDKNYVVYVLEMIDNITTDIKSISDQIYSLSVQICKEKEQENK